MGTTNDRNDPGINKPRGPDEQNESYIVLGEDDLPKEFVRPVRRSYQHVVCGAITTMSLAIAETYARDPKFYGATWCMACKDHLPVIDFRWDEPDQTIVGS